MRFLSCSRVDIDGIEPGRTLILLHNFDKRIIYGCYRAVDVGLNLDKAFGKEWCYQVRVQPLGSPISVPTHLLEPYLPRKQKNGVTMKFIEKASGAVREVWHLMHFYAGKGLKAE